MIRESDSVKTPPAPGIGGPIMRCDVHELDQYDCVTSYSKDRREIEGTPGDLITLWIVVLKHGSIARSLPWQVWH
jgi:hypothetical protein